MAVQSLAEASPLKIFLFPRRSERGPLPPFPELNLLLPGSKKRKAVRQVQRSGGAKLQPALCGRLFREFGGNGVGGLARKAERPAARLHELCRQRPNRRMDLAGAKRGRLQEPNSHRFGLGNVWTVRLPERTLEGSPGRKTRPGISESSTKLRDRGKERRFSNAAAVRFLENALGIEAALRVGLGRANALSRKFSGSAASARIQKISARSKNAAEAERTEPWSATRVRACLQALQGSDNARARPPRGPKRPPKGWKRGGNAQKFCHPKSAHGFHSEF